MVNLILLLGRALDSWAEQLSKEYLEDEEREAKKRENALIEEKKHNFNNDYLKWPIEKPASKYQDVLGYTDNLPAEKPKPYKPTPFYTTQNSIRYRENLSFVNFKPYKPTPPYAPPTKTSDDKIIEKKIDQMKMRQAGEHKKKMERMNAEGRAMMSAHWAKMDMHMNRGFR